MMKMFRELCVWVFLLRYCYIYETEWEGVGEGLLYLCCYDGVIVNNWKNEGAEVSLSC